MGKGLLYCICLHHFYTPSYGDMKMVKDTPTDSCSSFQIIFKAAWKGSRERDLDFIMVTVNKCICTANMNKFRKSI